MDNQSLFIADPSVVFSYIMVHTDILCVYDQLKG